LTQTGIGQSGRGLGIPHVSHRWLSQVDAGTGVVLASLVVLNLSLAIPWVLPRAIISLPCLAITPGYSLVLLFFGRGSPPRGVALPALSVMLSIAFLALLGVALDLLLIPLTLASTVAAVDGTTVVATLVAIRLYSRPMPAARASVVASIRTHVTAAVCSDSVRLVIVFASFAVALLAVVAAEQRLDRPSLVDQFSEFYLTGAWAQVSQEVDAQPGQPLHISVAVANRTKATHRYYIVADVDARKAQVGSTVVVHGGATWIGVVHALVPSGGCLHRVGLDLYVDGTHQATSDLVIWAYGSAHDQYLCAKGG